MKTLIVVLLLAWAGATGLALQLTTPCRTEDSTMCTWDASARSNGKGISFVALWDTEHYIITGGK